MRVSRQRRPAVCRHFPIFPHLFELLPDGRRRYVVKYRVKGGRNARQRWFGLGTHGQVTCEQARARALQVLSAMARGEDPRAQLIVERTAPTVAELWARYKAEHLPRKKERSGAGDRQKARDHVLPALGRLKVDEVRRADIHRLHQKLSDRPSGEPRPRPALQNVQLGRSMGNEARAHQSVPSRSTVQGECSTALSRPPELRALAGCLAGTRGIRRYFHVCSGSHKPSIISPESPASRAGGPYRRRLGRRS